MNNRLNVLHSFPHICCYDFVNVILPRQYLNLEKGSPTADSLDLVAKKTLYKLNISNYYFLIY